MSTRFALIVNFGYFGAVQFLHNDIGNSLNQIWVQTIINWGKIILHLDVLDDFTGIVFPLDDGISLLSGSGFGMFTFQWGSF